MFNDEFFILQEIFPKYQVLFISTRPSIFISMQQSHNAGLLYLGCISMDHLKSFIIVGDHEGHWSTLFLMEGNQYFTYM